MAATGTRGSNTPINSRPSPKYDSAGNDRPQLPDDPALKPSFGEDVPHVEGFKTGYFCNFGILAGKNNSAALPEGIHIEDSIRDQFSNLPGSRKHD